MEWSFDTTDATRVGEVRRAVLGYLDRHAQPGSPLRIAELAYDELVGNASRYAPGPVQVQVDWSEPRPVLHVRDTGPGFRLTDAVSEEARGGLRLLTKVAGPVHLSPDRDHGAAVSLQLPLLRALEPPVPVSPGPDSSLAPAADQVASDGTVGRDAYLGALVVHLAATVDQTHGPAAAQAAVTAAGTSVGSRIEREYRRARALTDRLTPQQVADLLVSLEAAVGGDFSTVSVSDDEIVLRNRRCPFGAAVRTAPSLCRTTSSVFAGIAARGTGHGDVTLEERIAVGDPQCRVVVSLRPRRPEQAASSSADLRGERLRAVLAEDTAFLREPLLHVLADGGVDVVAQCDSAREVLDRVRTYRPDVAVVDLREDRTPAALEVARTVRREHPATGVVVLAEHVDVDSARHLLETASTGVGYLLKDRIADVDDFVHQVRAVAADGTAIDAEVLAGVARLDAGRHALDDLTAREGDVLRLLAEGLDNDGIAERLVVTKRAVEKHVSSIFLKLDLPPSTGGQRRVLAALAYRRHRSGT